MRWLAGDPVHLVAADLRSDPPCDAGATLIHPHRRGRERVTAAVDRDNSLALHAEREALGAIIHPHGLRAHLAEERDHHPEDLLHVDLDHPRPGSAKARCAPCRRDLGSAGGERDHPDATGADVDSEQAHCVARAGALTRCRCTIRNTTRIGMESSVVLAASVRGWLQVLSGEGDHRNWNGRGALRRRRRCC